MTQMEIGCFVATFADRYGVVVANEAGKTFAAVARQEVIVAEGGFRAIEGETEIWPSCCAGLETWREWARVIAPNEAETFVDAIDRAFAISAPTFVP